MKTHSSACLFLLGFAISVFATAAFSASTCSASAGTGNPRSEHSSCSSAPASLPRHNEPDVGAGNPINVITGNKYQKETDLIALPGELGIEVIRHYNSLATHETGHVGKGWRLSYETELRMSENAVELIQAEGTRFLFRCVKLTCTTGNYAQGTITIAKKTDEKPSYIWRWLTGVDAGRSLHFNENGLLQSIQSKTGAVLKIERSSTGRIERIIDPLARVLTFYYPSPEEQKIEPLKFDGVVAIETPVGRIDYRYGSPIPQKVSTEHSVNVKGQSYSTAYVLRQSNLVSAQFTPRVVNVVKPVQSTEKLAIALEAREYLYESTFDGQHAHLTAILFKGQRLSTYIYDATGFAVLSSRGMPARLRTDEFGTLVTPRQLEEGTGIEQVVLQRRRQGETLLINSLGKETVYKYEVIAKAPRLVSVRGPGCSSCAASDMRYQYDAKGRVAQSIRMGAGGFDIDAQIFHYDASDRLTRVEQANFSGSKAQQSIGQIMQFTYATNGPAALHLPVAIASKSVVLGKETFKRFTYNEQGLLTEFVEEGYSPQQPDSAQLRVWKMRYAQVQSQWMLISIDGPLANGPLNSPSDSDITLYKYENSVPLASKIVNPGGFETTLNYDSAGRINQSVDNDFFRKIRTSITYADSGRIANNVATTDQIAWLLQRNAEGASTSPLLSTEQKTTRLTSKFDAERLLEATDAAGASTKFHYDSIGRQIGFSDMRGYRSERTLTTESLMRRSALYLPKETRPFRANYYQYDDYGRPVHRLLADGQVQTWQYSHAHQLAAYIAGNNTVSHFTDNAFARLTSEQTVDGYFRLQITDRSSGAADQWDDFGQKVLTYLPDHGNRLHRYDDAGRLHKTTQIDGTSVSYQWDNANRLVRKVMVDSQGGQTFITLSYQGRLLESVEDPEQTTRFEYDALARPVSESTSIPALKTKTKHVFRTETSYDRTGLVSTRTLADGRSLRILRKSKELGAGALQLNLESRWVTELSKLIPGIAHWIGVTPIVSDIVASPFDGLSSFRFGNGAIFEKKFDLASRVTHINDSAVGRQIFSYEAGPKIHALRTEGAIGQMNTSFAYDGFGQLLPKVSEQTSKQFPTLPLVIQDSRGRVLEDDQFRYSYTVHGQIATISNANTNRLVASYSYNALKQRVSKTVYTGDVTQKYYYLWRDGKLVAEIDAHGQIEAQYLYLVEATKVAMPIAKINTKKILFIHSDHRAAPIAMTNEKRNVVWKSSLLQNSTEVLNIRFPGQYYDQETGLHDNWHRSFNPATGRYLQPDPLGYPDGPDAYLYAGGDPVNKVDVKGLYETDVHYYMTYFLGRMAGISAAESYTIALAAQYIDDNPDTWPVDETQLTENVRSPAASTRLEYYHFTTTSPHWFNNINYDPPRTMAELAYVQLTTYETNSYVNRRYKNPVNPQIAKLAGYASSADNRCRKAQFFGEYLHALEDTFSHRDKLNAPIDTNRGVGHGYYGHAPDKTYNHTVAPHWTLSLGSFGTWNQNEARTMQMEFEVFGKMRSAYSSTGRNRRTNTDIKFRDFAGFLEDWNRTQDNQDKVLLLNDKLAEFGFGPIPAYDRICAESKRKEYIGGLNQNLYSGTILPVRAAPAGTAAASCGG
jgi:RHS repeat-associated protein